jgi:SCP-2 sterol transfer family
MPYPFLSDEWLEEARRIRAEYEGKGTSIPHVLRMNLVVTSVPFGERDIDAHLDTSGNELQLDTGHLDNPDLTVTVEYETAKAILVDGNPQAGLQALMAGKIRVDGDMTKLMALQTAPPGAGSAAAEMATRLKEITE